MQAGRQRWQGIRTLWATLCLALSLAVAPAIEAIKHGPGAMAAEALKPWADKAAKIG